MTVRPPILHQATQVVLHHESLTAGVRQARRMAAEFLEVAPVPARIRLVGVDLIGYQRRIRYTFAPVPADGVVPPAPAPPPLLFDDEEGPLTW